MSVRSLVTVFRAVTVGLPLLFGALAGLHFGVDGFSLLAAGIGASATSAALIATNSIPNLIYNKWGEGDADGLKGDIGNAVEPSSEYYKAVQIGYDGHGLRRLLSPGILMLALGLTATVGGAFTEELLALNL